MKTTIETPGVAILCYVFAWLGLLGGGALVAMGISDSANPHVSGAAGEMTTGFALFIGSIFWFGIAKIIALLAQIDFNTRSRP